MTTTRKALILASVVALVLVYASSPMAAFTICVVVLVVFCIGNSIKGEPLPPSKPPELEWFQCPDCKHFGDGEILTGHRPNQTLVPFHRCDDCEREHMERIKRMVEANLAGRGLGGKQ